MASSPPAHELSGATASGTRDTVLVVDDDPLSLDLAAAILENEDFRVEIAGDGERAWQGLAANPGRVLAVVLDRQMPGLSGLDVLIRMKQTPACRDIPVVFLSGLASSAEVARGIAAGAFYYVTKPYEPAILRSVVRSAVNDFRQRLRLRSDLESTANAISLLEAGVFHCRTPDEAQALAELLSKLCPQPEAVVTGLWELLLNAIEHGNLGLGYAEKTAGLAAGNWQAEIAHRLGLPAYARKVVVVKVERRPDAIVFRITDQGDGFDPTSYLDFDPERVVHAHGRGIAMARLMSFQSLSYNAKGNAVEATVAR